MGKYDPLWLYINKNAPESLSFNEIEHILGFPIDHSFLNCKKELLPYGYKIGKISIKNKVVAIEKA